MAIYLLIILLVQYVSHSTVTSIEEYKKTAEVRNQKFHAIFLFTLSSLSGCLKQLQLDRTKASAGEHSDVRKWSSSVSCNLRSSLLFATGENPEVVSFCELYEANESAGKRHSRFVDKMQMEFSPS